VNGIVKALLTLCVAVLGLAAAGIAQADRGHAGRAGLVRPLLAAVHADVTIVSAKGETTTRTWDKGTVSVKTATSITLSRKDGKSVTLSIDSSTKTRGDVEQGKPALVVSNGGKALAILAHRGERSANAVRDKGRGAGKAGLLGLRGAVHVGWALIMPDGSAMSLAFDRGEVTAASTSSITLKRADNVSVTLTIDSTTKVRARDGKIDVGDRAAVFSQGGTAKAILAGAAKRS
jgi:hypothetical protein